MDKSQSLPSHPRLQRKGPHGCKGRALEHRCDADAVESIPAPMATTAPADGDRGEGGCSSPPPLTASAPHILWILRFTAGFA